MLIRHATCKDGIMDLPRIYVPDSWSELSSLWVRSRQIETCSDLLWQQDGSALSTDNCFCTNANEHR